MRRFIAILLLVLLPLQSSWAAIDAHGASEAQAEHAGHLDHRHAAPAALADGLDTEATSAGDAVDCAECHVHCHCIGMLTVVNGLDADPATAPRQAGIHEVAGSQPAIRPERPQWAPLA